MNARTLYEKIWDEHVVVPETSDTPAVLYIDLHLIHEVTTPQAFQVLRERGLSVRRPERTLATMDHSTPTTPVRKLADIDIVGPEAANQIRQMQANCREFGIELFDFGSEHRGIVHVIGPELGATQPGKTIVCGDSHTSTHGALGALAFGHRRHRGRARPRLAVLVAASSAYHGRQCQRLTACGRIGQRHHPGGHRQDWRRRRYGTRH